MPPDIASLSAFVSELRRRRVFRVAAVYAIVAWLIIQVAVSTFPYLQLPSWMVTAVIVLAAIGLPIAIVLAWAFEMTPAGVQRAELSAATAGPSTDTSPIPRRGGWMAGALVLGLFAVGAGIGWYRFAAAPSDGIGASEELSIAVLPFANLSADADNEYFSDGMTEDILTQLALIHDLSVVSRTSVMQYKGTDLTIPEIATELGVSFILEGSVRRVGDQVRIVAQLIDARTDEHLWAETYDRQMKDVFAVQSEVALRIAGAMEATLSPEERGRIVGRPTENMAAYDLVLRARELSGAGREENRTAVELLKQAIQLDRGFAGAYATLAGAYMFRVQQFGYPIEWADSGIVAARKAIALDPELPRAYSVLGSNLRYRGRLEEASTAYNRALELNPSSATVMNNLGSLELARGNYDAAIPWLERSMRLDPTSSFPPLNLGIVYSHLGYPDISLGWFERASEADELEVPATVTRIITLLTGGRAVQASREIEAALIAYPDDFIVLYTAGLIALSTGDWTEAENYLERLFRISPDARPGGSPMVRTLYALALLKNGEKDRANDLLKASILILQRELDSGSEDPAVPYGIAEAHAILGNQEEAMRWLQRSYDAGMRQYANLLFDPSFDELRGRAPFERLLARIKSDIEIMRERVNGRTELQME